MNFLLLILVAAAVAATQMLAGGRQIALCLPGYGLLVIAAVLSWWPARRIRIPRAATECLVAAVILFSYISIRALFSPEEYLARKDLYAALAGMTLYLLVALNVTGSKLRLLLVGGILALALANCAIGAVQFFKGHNFMPFPLLPRPDYGSRASGFYGYPNNLAGFLEMALMFGLSIAFWSRWPSWAKMLVGYVSLMCLLGIVITGSRGGYIAAAVGSMVFVVLSLVLVGKLASGKVIGLIVVGLVLIGGVGWGVKNVMAKSFFLQSRADTTLTVDASRMRIWQAAWKEFRLQPAIGTGSGTFLYYGRQFRNPAVHADPVHAHNDYFELLGEYGILGIIAAVIFLETHLRHAWNSFSGRLRDGAGLPSMGSNSLALTVGALSAAAACLVHSLLDYNLHMAANQLTAALVFGLLATPGEGPEARDMEREPGFSPWLRFALPVLGILTAVRIMPTAPAEYYMEQARTILADWQRSVAPEMNVKLEAIARRGLAWNPHHPDLHYALAEALSGQGDLASDPATKDQFHEQAIESYRQALDEGPGDVSSVLALAGALDAAGRFTKSEPLYTRAVELDPSGGLTHFAFGNHLVLQDKFAEADTQFRLAHQFGAWEAAKAGFQHIQEELKAKGEGNPSAPPGIN